MPRFCLKSFGCRASQADGASVKRQLLEMGLEEANGFDGCDLAILNTCTVTATADAEARQVIRRAQRTHPGCKILVTGCYAQRAPEELAGLPGVAWVVGNSHKYRIPQIVREEIASAALQRPGEARPPCEGPVRLVQLRAIQEIGQSRLVAAPPAPGASRRGLQSEILVGDIGDEFHFAPAFADDRTRPTLKIQDGCNARCSFCVIPRVRGRSRSLDAGLVIGQIRALVEQGYREVVLSGINLGGYGRELIPPVSFLGLLEKILRATSIERLRISSIEPMDVSRELIELAAREPRLAEHFHVPLQSGCGRILRLMTRRYRAAHYRERIAAIRERMPNAALGADVMAGFPTETAEDHAESLRFIESLPLTYLHVFPYSERPGTRAPSLPHAVDGRRARERCRELQSLGKAKQQAFLRAQTGKTLSALTLHEARDGARLALTSNYLKVALPCQQLPANLIVDARIIASGPNLLVGTTASNAAAGSTAVPPVCEL